jgi:hypothetical protein
MLELEQALTAYIDGGTLPDGTVPIYSDDIRGNATTGLERRVAIPDGDLGFGRELSCFDDFTEDFQMVDSASTLAALQSNYRRLNTPLGFLDLIGEPSNFGFDVRGLLQQGFKPGDVKRWQDEIREQLLEDDRNLTCACVVRPVDPDGIEIDLNGTTAAGPYSLTMVLVDGELTIRAMNAEALNA